MKLSFLGATATVTGSKYLLEVEGKKYLIDCGLFQGLKELRLRNREPFPVDPKTIEAVILTHAHLDHTGYIPLLVKQGFKGKIYCSQGTRDLCEILLLDAGRIQEEDTRRANKYGYTKHHPALPLYTEDDAKKSLEYFHTIDFNKSYPLESNLMLSLSWAGHILGSSFLTLKHEGTTLVFTGDMGRPNDPVMKPPVQIESADYLVLESTYGDRLHPKIDILTQLEQIFKSTFAKGGSVIIPAFTVGRTQVLLYYIYELKKAKRLSPNIPIYLDSPMAQNVTNLLCKYGEEHRLDPNVCSNVCSVAEYVQTPQESKNLYNSSVPSIIISASGMAEGGRILHHLAHFAPEKENTILFAGYQAEGTRGARMLRGEKEIKIHGHMVPIRARVETLDTLSSHADYEEILRWLKGFKSAPKEVFIIHGEPQACESLKSKIEEALGWKVTVPKYQEVVEI